MDKTLYGHMYTLVAAKMKEFTDSWLTAFWSSNSCNSVNICPIFKHEMSEYKFMLHLSETNKNIKKRTKDFCSIVDQMQDLFWDTR